MTQPAYVTLDAVQQLAVLRAGVIAILQRRPGLDYLALPVLPRHADESRAARRTIADELIVLAYAHLCADEGRVAATITAEDVVETIEEKLPYGVGAKGALKHLAHRSDPVTRCEQELCDTVWAVVARLLDGAIARSESLRKLTRGLPPEEAARRRVEIRNAILEHNFPTIAENFDPSEGPLARYVAYFAKPGSLRQKWEGLPDPEWVALSCAPTDEAVTDAAIERLGGEDPIHPEVHAILRALPPHLVRYFAGGLKAGEAGAPDGLTADAVYRDSKRVRSQLRRLIPYRRAHKEEEPHGGRLDRRR